MALRYLVQSEGAYIVYGLSSDTKPPSTIDASLFIETDTGRLFSVQNGEWVPLSLLGTGDNFVTDAEKTKLSNLSGINTGDQILPVKATVSEVDTGTNDTKFLTPKVIEESSYVKYTHVSVSTGVTTTGANINPVNITGAIFTYVNNAVYRIWVMGRVNSTAATTGIGIQFDLSTAITDINVITEHPLATTGTSTMAYSIADVTSAGLSSGVPAGPLDVPFFTTAILRVGNNTGTCQLQVRSETTAVTELMAGVTMVVERLL